MGGYEFRDMGGAEKKRGVESARIVYFIARNYRESVIPGIIRAINSGGDGVSEASIIEEVVEFLEMYLQTKTSRGIFLLRLPGRIIREEWMLLGYGDKKKEELVRVDTTCTGYILGTIRNGRRVPELYVCPAGMFVFDGGYICNNVIKKIDAPVFERMKIRDINRGSVE